MILLSTIKFAALCLILLGTVRAEGPVVGILFLPYYIRTRLQGSYMLASYTKWISQMRMRWIPLYMDDPEDILKEKLMKVNGILLTGGGTPILEDDADTELIVDELTGGFTRYGKWVQKVVHQIQKLNDEGTYKAIWGTCLGFESLLLALTNQTIKLEGKLENLQVVLPVDYQADSGERLTSVFSQDDFQRIRSTKTFYFNHHFGFLWENALKNTYIQENIRLHASLTTVTGHQILASFEHKKYPFFAIQFHPENSQFAFRDAYPSAQVDLELEMAYKLSKVARHLMRTVSSSITDAEIVEYRSGAVFSWHERGEEIYMNRGRHRAETEALLV